VEEVLIDIQLIWDNCKKYNTPGSVPLNNRRKFIQWHVNWKI